MPANITKVSTIVLTFSLTYGPAVVTRRRTFDHREGIGGSLLLSDGSLDSFRSRRQMSVSQNWPVVSRKVIV